MTPGHDGTFVVLAAGLRVQDLETVHAALRGALPDAELFGVDTVAGAVAIMRAHTVGCALVGSHVVDRGDWGSMAAEVRRGAPAAALIALPQNDAVGHGWDDVVRPADRDARLMTRVLRSARAIAAANERLTRWALRDPLTDVLNRRGLQRVLGRETAARERGQGPLVALLVDCDDFKRVNDEFGLAAGDRALAAVARALQGAVRGGDTVARVGGDEFLVLLPQTRTWEAVEVAERIRERVREHAVLPDGGHLSVSIGVRRLDETASTFSEVLEATQSGLSLSKAGGKDRVRVVDTRNDEDTGHPHVDLEKSLPPGARLHPYRRHRVVRLSTGEVARWIVELQVDAESELRLDAQRAAQSAWDLHWLRQAAQQLPDADVPVHLRVFPATLMEVSARQVLHRLPDELTPHRLVLAIDEQFLSGAPSDLAVRLREMRKQGVGLCIDAVALGAACLESLVLLRPGTVRIDSGLVRGLSTSRPRRVAIQRFVEVCRALDVDVIAMGLDSRADLLAATEIGISLGAGRRLMG